MTTAEDWTPFEGGIDDDGYPEGGMLRSVTLWPATLRHEWLDYIAQNWPPTGKATWGDDELRLVTGGWSGCEEIIQAMQQNTMCWMMCWESSFRGGTYRFKAR